jgi:hypothetical protein
MPRKSASVAEVAAPEVNTHLNKVQAIEVALKELGKRASTKDLVGYAKQKFNLDVTPQYVSVIKSTLKKRQGKQPRKERMQAEEVNGHTNPNGRRGIRTTGTADDPAELVREVKALAQKLGGLVALKRLVEALAE